MSTLLQMADLRLDPVARQVWRGQRQLTLTAREYQLLLLLLRHRGTVVSRERILEEIWAEQGGGASNVIEVYVRYLRQKLEQDGEPRLIHTVRGRGYCLSDGRPPAGGRGHEARAPPWLGPGRRDGSCSAVHRDVPGGPPQFLPLTAQACLEDAAPARCIQLEVPRGDRQYAMGLQMRPPLPPLRGMWFPYAPPAPARFWMHRTPEPLDMLFIRDGRVIALESSRPPLHAPALPQLRTRHPGGRGAGAGGRPGGRPRDHGGHVPCGSVRWRSAPPSAPAPD